jgi:hypothetical protein
MSGPSNLKNTAETICDALYKSYPELGPCHRFSSDVPCTEENCLAMQTAYALGKAGYVLIKETEEYIDINYMQRFNK